MAGFSWEATVEDVAELLPQRTKGEFGRKGEFNDDTTPTKKQVEGILAKAAGRIAAKLQVTEEDDICSDGPIEMAEEVHALRAAMVVERTYFSNQLRTDQSPYKALKDEYDSSIKDLLEAYEDQCGGGGGDGGIGGEEMPSGNFPRSGRWGSRRF